MISVLIVSYGTKSEIDKVIPMLLFDSLISTIFILENRVESRHDWDEEKLGAYGSLNHDRLRIHFSEENLGYGPGINFLLAKVETEYALFLNPDCVPDLKSLKLIASHIFNCVCAIVSGALVSPSGEIDSRYPYVFVPSSRPTLVNDHEFTGKLKVGHFPGAMALVNVHKIGLIGGYSNLFMYYDEVDTTLELQKIGFTVHLLDLTVGTHIRAFTTSDTQFQKSAFTAYCSAYSAVKFTLRQFPKWLPSVILARMVNVLILLADWNPKAAYWNLKGTAAALFNYPSRPPKPH